MVAYSFKSRFIQAIIDGTKQQTIRGPRPQHARPGNTIQLFTGMRTKHCKRIVPDVLCIDAHPVIIDLSEFDPLRLYSSTSVVIPDGAQGRMRRLSIIAEIEAFAVADGFADFPEMVRFWLETHGRVRFEGTIIKWGNVRHGR